VNNAVKFIEGRLLAESFFLYTAFAPVQANTRDQERQKEVPAQILVKVGISTVPMNRIVAVHMNSPFRVAYAAFTPLLCAKRKAEKTESAILMHFRQYRTRGEWLLMPNTKESKEEFAYRSRIIIARDTGRPVEWRRVSADELVRYALKLPEAA
jgi:hypothetical protein